MGGFDPSVTREAMNDPAMILRVLGMLAPNVYYNMPGGAVRPAFRPGMALSALGEGYENIRTRQEQERQLKGMSTGLAEQGMFPWEKEARDLRDAETISQPGAQEIKQQLPLQVQARLRPEIAPFGEYMSRLRTPVQFRVAAGLEDFYGRRTAEIEKKYDIMKSDLLGEAATVLKKDPFNEDAQNAVLVLLKDAADPKIRGGSAVNLASVYRTNQASYQMLVDSGMASNLAKSYVDTGQAQKEIEYNIGRNREIAKATQIAEATQGMLGSASRELVFALAANGITPGAEWFSKESRNTQFEFMKSQYPTAWAQLVAGMPLDQPVLQELLRLVSGDPEAAEAIQKHQAAATAQAQREAEVALQTTSVGIQQKRYELEVMNVAAQRRNELLLAAQTLGRMATEREQDLSNFTQRAKNEGYSDAEITAQTANLRKDFEDILAQERETRTQYLKGSPEGRQRLIHSGRAVYDSRLGLLEAVDRWANDPVKVAGIKTAVDRILKDLDKDATQYMKELDPSYYTNIKTRLEAVQKVASQKITEQGGSSITKPPETEIPEGTQIGRVFRPGNWQGPITRNNPVYPSNPVYVDW